MKGGTNDPGLTMRKRYCESIKLLRDVCPGSISYLISICERARSGKSPEVDARALDTAVLSETKIQAKHARKLATFLRKYFAQTRPAVCEAIDEAGFHLQSKNDDISVGPFLSRPLKLARLLEALADNLEKKKVLARVGPFEHRFAVGPLLLDKPVEGKAAVPKAETCLAIYLSYLFRVQSLRKDGEVFDERGQMPKEGNPRWPLVAQLVCDSFGVDATEHEIQNKANKVLRRYPGLQIVGYE